MRVNRHRSCHLPAVPSSRPGEANPPHKEEVMETLNQTLRSELLQPGGPGLLQRGQPRVEELGTERGCPVPLSPEDMAPSF